nr:ATP-dependent DNA ligase [Subtercola lobariae]
MDDRTLTHLQIVIVRKLRLSEGFAMSWAFSPDFGSGRASVWIHPTIPLHFKFSGSRVPSINPVWLAELTESANSSRGLIVTAENSLYEATVPGHQNRSQSHPKRVEQVTVERRQDDRFLVSPVIGASR